MSFASGFKAAPKIGGNTQATKIFMPSNICFVDTAIRLSRRESMLTHFPYNYLKIYPALFTPLSMMPT